MTSPTRPRSSAARSRLSRTLHRSSIRAALAVSVIAMSAAFGALGSTIAPASASQGPPAIEKCWYTGISTTPGDCEGMQFRTPASVVVLTNPDKNGDFKLTGPAPLQTKAPVTCGDAGCLYNHLNWSPGGQVVTGCQPNLTFCEVKVNPGYAWTPVFVAQNDYNQILFLLWNSGTPSGTISGYVRDQLKHGVPGLVVKASGPRTKTAVANPTARFYEMGLPAGNYTVSGSGGPRGTTCSPKSSSVSLSAGTFTKTFFTTAPWALSLRTTPVQQFG